MVLGLPDDLPGDSVKKRERTAVVATIATLLALLSTGCGGDSTSPSGSGVADDGTEFPIVFTAEAFVDPEMERIESTPGVYGFELPVKADRLYGERYAPARCATYFKDTFSPRLLAERFDLHAGFDIDCCGMGYGGVDFDCNDNPPPVFSVCNGSVYRIDRENKGSIYVECDREYAGNPWGNIRVVYRHLSQFHPAIVAGGDGYRVSVDDTIGIMGKEDANTVHLHFSANSTSSGRNRHPARLFDPTVSPFFTFLDSADIRILENTGDELVVRMAIPGNMVGINRFAFEVAGKSVVYDAEQVIATADGSEERDDPGFVEGMEIYAYPYNGYESACEGWEDEMDELPADFPASAHRKGYHPIPCEGLYGTASLVYDVVLQVEEPIPSRELFREIGVSLLDVFGHGVRTRTP